MAYDESLADRVRAALAGADGIAEQPMFGGLTFMHRGHMACGVLKNDLVVRMSPEGAEQALASMQAEPMLFTGRAMKGMVQIPAAKVADVAGVRPWVARALEFTSTLPLKSKSGSRRGAKGAKG